ncbi:MAG: prepilin peptidase, partial [Candidatus Cloacimonetes bacterium]|nr:prepilin peptidase [Candidatus Cloacimonadota bacterium]MCK9185736.1 prepilin peptidase [Candidatus Cloacimonadota bacterium]
FGLLSMPYVVLMAALLGIIYFLIFVRDKSKGFAFGTFIAFTAVSWALLGAVKLVEKLPFL